MAAEVTKKNQQGESTADSEQVLLKRMMEIDMDPGRDAEIESIGIADGAGTEGTAALDGIPLATDGSGKPKE